MSIFSSAYARAMVKVPFTLFIFPLKYYYSIFPSRNNTGFRSPFTGLSSPNGRHKILKLMGKRRTNTIFRSYQHLDHWHRMHGIHFVSFFFLFVKEIGLLFADYLFHSRIITNASDCL